MSTIQVPANALAILVGPAGCGKSTFARERFSDTQVVSSDECRRLVSDDEGDQGATPQAYAVFHALVEGRLALGRLAVADATNLEARSRATLREYAARYGAPVVALVIDSSLEQCLEQARTRERVVRPEVIEMHYRAFEEARAALPAEGYDAVHAVGPGTSVEIGPAAGPAGARLPNT